MNKHALQQRTRLFHIGVIKLCETLPRNAAGYEIARQVIRSAGSVAANYRATARAKSKADFIYKIKVVLEEADEAYYWLQIIEEAGLQQGETLSRLIQEANELTAIFTATDKTINRKKSSM